MNYQIKQTNTFQYIDEGQGHTLLLLHGLFGALSNWEGFIEYFKHHYRVVIPMLPIYTMPPKEAGVEGLTAYTEAFVEAMNLTDMTLLGNSLGGHIALTYTLQNPTKVRSLVLTGSSGLFENQMGGGFVKRGSYEFVAERVAHTFYDPAVATKELIDEVFEVTTNNQKALNIVYVARSAQKNNMASQLPSITAPTLLVWGLNDTITPASVAYEFNHLMPNATLHFIDHCCHAPMMERPERFNELTHTFLKKQIAI